MENSVADLFVILSINPHKGRISVDSIHFRYSLTGALIMDYLEKGELKVDNKRLVPSMKKTGEAIHDLFVDKFMNSTRNKRLSYWIRNLTHKSRFILREITGSLENKQVLRIEHKKFLNIFPYRRYWFVDRNVRPDIIERLRGILLYGKKAGKKEIMLLGLVEASRAYRLVSHERGESKILRKKNVELLKGDVISAEISQAIREVQAAIVVSITTAVIATHSSH